MATPEPSSRRRVSRKIVIAGLVLLAICLARLIVWLGSRPGPSTPAFRVAREQPHIGRVTSLSYEFLALAPFEGGKIWITAIQGLKGYHCFLYDLRHQAIEGELVNAGPAFMNADQSKLLCARAGLRGRTLLDGIAELLQLVSRGKIGARPRLDRMETFWVLDLKKNTAKRLGLVRSWAATCEPSPGFRYGYLKPVGAASASTLVILDLEKETLTTLVQDGWPQGWWDDRHILMKDSTNNFILYDVVERTRSPLLNAAQVADFLKQSGIPDDPSLANLFPIWKGKVNEFYLADTHKKWQAVESYLIKMERAVPSLRLLSPNFKFGWSDHLDATGNYYVYSGREAGDASSAVFLRDLRNNTTRTLVASDNGKYFSLPRFDRDAVIYVRSNMLWRIKLDGSPPVRLFPPAGSPAEN